MTDEEAAALVAKAARGGRRKGRAGRRTQLVRLLDPWFQFRRDEGDSWDAVAAALVQMPGYSEAFGTINGYQLATIRSHIHRVRRRKPTVEELVQAEVARVLTGLVSLANQASLKGLGAAQSPDEDEVEPPDWAVGILPKEMRKPVAPAAPEQSAGQEVKPVASADPAAAPAETKPATPVPAPETVPKSFTDMTSKTSLDPGPTTLTSAGKGLSDEIIDVIRSPNPHKKD